MEPFYHALKVASTACIGCTHCMSLCTTQAIHYIGSTPTAILGALEPVTAVFFGVVIFHEELTARLGLGIALILVAVTLIVAGGRFASFLLRFRRLFPKRHRKTEA